MRFLTSVVPAALLLAATGGVALGQSVVAPQGGSLPPPRPVQAPPAATVPAQPSRPPAAAAPSPQPAAPPRQPAPPATARPPAPPAQAPRPAQAQPAQPGQAARPQAQPRPAQPPAVGTQTPPQNRRPAAGAAAGAAAAGAAAGAAAAGAAASRPPEPPPPPQPSIGPATGLPLPRFASLRSDEVNLRVGPNTTFPIEWTFQRRELPVQIIGEFQLWRRIRDPDGAEGWVHSSTLAGRRTALVRPTAGTEELALRRRAEESGPPVARLRPGVIARVRECEAASAWCEVQVAGHRGYLRRADIWGVGAEEEVK